MKEKKSCIHPFIKRTQGIFSKGGSLAEALSEIPVYQKRLDSVYKDNVYFAHAIAVSRAGLGTVVAYEYIRSRGLPLPGLDDLVDMIMPLKMFSERALFREREDPRYQEIEEAYKA